MSMMLLGAGPSVGAGGGGGGGVAFVDAMDPTNGTSVATLSQSGAAGLNPSGSNRFAIGGIHTVDFGSQATHLDMDLGSSSFDQVGSTANFFSFNSASVWQLIAPSTGAQTASGDWSASQLACSIGMVCYSGVNQSTPIGTAFTNSGSFATTTGSVTVTVTGTTSGRTVVGVAFPRDSNAGPISVTNLTPRYNSSSASGETTSTIIWDQTASGASTNMQLDISVPVADTVEWYVFAFELIPA